MNNVSSDYLRFYQPKTALLIYQHAAKPDDYYIESYEIDARTGTPINAHPLTINEATALGKRLNAAQEKHIGFLVPDGLMPDNVLHLNSRGEGLVIWHTPMRQQKLYFTKSMGINNGTASVPALLWIGTKSELQVFALKSNKRPSMGTALYHSPLFNTSANGDVCIGNVEIKPLDDVSLNEFIKAWQDFYFNSEFSHLNGHLPISVDPKQFWNQLIETDNLFPAEVLQSAKTTLKSILP